MTTYTKPYPKAYVDAMEKVVAMPSGARRWRASAAIWLNLNPVSYYNDDGTPVYARDHYQAIAGYCKEKRENLKTRFGEIGESSQNNDARELIQMPAGMWEFIQLFDKSAFDNGNPDAKKNLEKLWGEFKEFNVAKAI